MCELCNVVGLAVPFRTASGTTPLSDTRSPRASEKSRCASMGKASLCPGHGPQSSLSYPRVPKSVPGLK